MRIFVVILLFLFSFRLSAQVLTDDAEFNRILDSILKASELSKRDLSLFNYGNEKVKFILPEIKKFQSDNLSSINFSEKFANSFKNSKDILNPQIISDLIKYTDFKKFQLIEYDDILSNEYINQTLGINLDSAFGFPGSLIIKQYLVPMLKVYSSMERDILFSQAADISFLKRYADSILFYENYNIENPFEFDKQSNEMDSITRKFFTTAEKVNTTNVFNLGFSLYLHYLKVNQRLMTNISDLKQQIKTTIIETSLGKIALGGSGNDTYKGNFILIVDIGGNDTYNISGFNKNLLTLTSVRTIIDFEGKDVYSSDDFAFGGAYFGINLNIDYSGDDKYTAKNSSLGSAAFGLGILHDFDGNDSYSAKSFSQGAGFFGIGLLIDNNGKDNYVGNSFSQGFGSTKGLGLLLDLKGDDKYSSNGIIRDLTSLTSRPFSFSQGAGLGFNNIGDGGFGFLIDISGNDSYKADNSSQGSGSYFSFGGLVDFDGNDIYKSGNLSVGSGHKNSFGIMIDYNGDDKYESEFLSIATGYDNGFGFLLDNSGEDTYQSKNIDRNKITFPGNSFLIDASGKNNYSGKLTAKISINDYNSNNIGMIDVFADIDNEFTTNIICSNDSPSKLMYFPNLKMPLVTSTKKKENQLSFSHLPKSIDSLLIIVNNRFSGDEKLISAAIDSLAAITEFNAEILLKGSVQDNFQLTTSKKILSKLLKDKKTFNFKILVDSLITNDVNKFELIASFLAQNFPNESKMPISMRLFDSNPQIRKSALMNLSIIEGGMPKENFQTLLDDKDLMMVAHSAYECGRLKPDGYLELLKNFFSDESFIIRNAAYAGIFSNLNLDISFMRNVIKSDIPLNAKKIIFKNLVYCDFKEKDMNEIAKIISSQKKELKEDFYIELSKTSSSKWQKKISIFIKNESDSELKKLLKNE